MIYIYIAVDSFRCMSLNENCCVLIQISPKSVPKRLITNEQPMVQIMAGAKGAQPLSEPMNDRLVIYIYIYIAVAVSDACP